MRDRDMQYQVNVCQRDYVQVQIDVPRKLLLGRWLKEPTAFQYKAVIALCVLALVRHKVDKVLINDQKKRPLTLDEQRWFVAKARALLNKGLLKKIAYVHSSDIFQQIIGEDMTKKLSSPEAPFLINSFYHEEEALEWLLS